jgi:hypothetical protein
LRARQSRPDAAQSFDATLQDETHPQQNNRMGAIYVTANLFRLPSESRQSLSFKAVH